MEKRNSAAATVSGDVAGQPDHAEALRIAEALLFASASPVSRDELRLRLPEGADVEAILRDLARTMPREGSISSRSRGDGPFARQVTFPM